MRSGLQVLAAMLDDDEELDIPMARGQVLFPDAQIEYVTAAGAGRRCNVEVASEHYGGGGSPLGHENPQTTQVYYEPSRPQVERAFREAMGRKAGDGIVAWQTCENTGCTAPEPASR